ncbi:hypothetical protein GOBAR_AA14594 [Gossypium barbadense]|uniref:Uncharacterized protein n=1 Tax=Gossypium barbadense TaxID=3634 RepID=A0A2P5XRX8_GOSBA|nr:hypothetical protein GOBAR_AA14594 [Gossypium barbadense]
MNHSNKIGDIEDTGMKEILSAVFDQLASENKPEYALAALIMGFIGLLGCTNELAYKSGKEKARWRWYKEIPWFYCPTATPNSYRRFGSFAEITRLVCAILQCVSATLAHVCYNLHAHNPIEFSFCSVTLASGPLFSQFLKDPTPKVTAHAHEDENA